MSQEQYDRVCREQFERINSKLDKIHSKLFVDNGSPSMQTRQDRTERLLKVALWLVTVVCATSISQVTKDVVMHIRQSQESIK